MRKKRFKNNVLVASLAVLVGIELIGVSVIGFWALGSLLDASETIALIMAAAGGLIALWATIRFTRSAADVERRFF